MSKPKLIGEWEDEVGKFCTKNKITLNAKGYGKVQALNDDRYFKLFLVPLKNFNESDEETTTLDIPYGERGLKILAEKETKPKPKKSTTRKEAEKIAMKMAGIENSSEIFTKRGQLEKFWKSQPFYYDTSKIFWLWDKKEFKWTISDEVDFCNLIYKTLGINTIISKDRSELVEGFKQIGRQHKPEAMKKSWVQFKDKIYDIKTGEVFNASPKFFGLNSIPWKVGESEETPTIDKLFSDWMKGQDGSWKKTLFEIIAYNVSRDQFMQRIIALCGGGSNGKGSFMKLNYRFLGEENCVSSEVKSLSEDKFEPAVLYGKLLCIMGEVSYDDLKNTNQLKKLGGEDKISFQFKGKTPFSDDNTATCVCQTNSMPTTPDKSVGFYRKWFIIDFLNQFKELKENLIEEIPDVEFENLAKKSLRILKELYDNQQFTNEGNFEERAKKYEERSNPVMKFVEEFCEETAGKLISLRDFTNACNKYLKLNHLRLMNSNQIGKTLREEGFIVGNRKIEDISAVVILNLILKTIKTTKTIIKSNRKPRVETNMKVDSFDISNSFSKKALYPSESKGHLRHLSKKRIVEEKVK